jgi:GPH family glycoside/pentoside/hexuronide:cation symporter
MIESEETQETRHSFWTFLSFGTYNISWTLPTTTMSVFMYFYYHTVVKLDPVLIFIVILLNTIWAALNDPLIGWLTDRNFKWTRKWGRRFPWIVLGFIPEMLALIMIFSAPSLDPANPLPVMLWLLFSLFLFDLFATLVDIHTAILRADKFRTEYERRKGAGFWGLFDMIAMALGMILPPVFIFFGTDNPLSYTVMAGIMALIGIIFVFTYIPGAREDKIVIDRYYSSEYTRLNVFKGLWLVIKQRSFTALYSSYVLFLAASSVATGMVAYLTIFILRSSDPEAMIIFLAFFLIGGLISVPVWLKLLKRMKNNKKLYLIGSIVLVCCYIPLTFFQTDVDLMIIMFLVGFGNGCVWTIGMPVMYSNVQDEFVVRTGKNQKGILVGTWAVIGLLTAFIDEALITMVFTATGFDAGYTSYAALEAAIGAANMPAILMGIRLLLGVIPALLVLIGTLIFWKFYPLTQEKVLENKRKLIELGF